MAVDGVVHVREALVVHVVQQPDDGPLLGVAAEARRRRPPSRPRRPGNGGAARGLDPLGQEVPRLLARKPHRHGCYPSRALRPGSQAPHGRVPSWRSSSSRAACRCRARSFPPATRTPRCRSWRRAALTADEVVVRNVPRIRDVEAMLDILRASARASSGAPTTRSPSAPASSTGAARRSTASKPSASAPRSCSPGRCWPASATPTCRRRAATSSAAGAWTRTSTPSRALGAEVDARRRDIAHARRPPARRRRLHGRAVGHGDRERAARRGADAGRDGDRQRGVRAARPGPRADAREDGRRHPGHRLQRAHRPRPRRAAAAARTRSPPTTSRSARSWRWPA